MQKMEQNILKIKLAENISGDINSGKIFGKIVYDKSE